MRLKHACTDLGQYGLNFPASEYSADGVRLIRTSDLSDDGLSDPSGGIFVPGPVEDRFLLRPGDLLLSRSGTVGRAFMTPEAAAGATFAGFLVRFRPGLATDPRFLYYVARSKSFQDAVAADSVVSTIQNFNAEKYANIEIPELPPEEQRRIADFLDDHVSRIDNIIAARGMQLDALARQEVLFIRQMVAGVGLPETSELPSTIPWLPKFTDRTRVRMLARVLRLQRGVDLADSQRRPGPVPVITTAGVVGTHAEAIAPGPGVVIGRYGSVGNVHWVTQAFWPHNTTLYVRDFQGNEPRWCYYLLRSYPYAALQARAAVPGINRNDMAVDLVPWLEPEDQRVVVSQLDHALALRTRYRAQLTKSITLFTEYKQSLISAAVTGELDVTTASRRVPA